MSRSADPGHYFQTSDALAQGERKATKAKNKHGEPIKLGSKVLAVCKDHTRNHVVFTAEAAGDVRRVDLESRTTKKIFTDAEAPLTCLSICPQTNELFAGSWNKTIYAIKLDGDEAPRRLVGHTDFVKCLTITTLGGKHVLISGGSDATIVVWDISTGAQLHKLKGHTKSLQDLAIDPESLEQSAAGSQDSVVLFSASSDREVRRWHISIDAAYQLPESLEKPILAHETSVYKLYFDGSGDLWTASADKTAKHLVRDREWEADTTLEHPDFVRDVVVAEDLGLVVTGCRDESVRVWDASSGKEVCTYEGHFEEVTGLVMDGQIAVVSVAIDATARTWGLLKESIEKYQVEAKKGGDETGHAKKDKAMLTKEEEDELAELMEDD